MNKAIEAKAIEIRNKYESQDMYGNCVFYGVDVKKAMEEYAELYHARKCEEAVKDWLGDTVFKKVSVKEGLPEEMNNPKWKGYSIGVYAVHGDGKKSIGYFNINSGSYFDKNNIEADKFEMPTHWLKEVSIPSSALFAPELQSQLEEKDKHIIHLKNRVAELRSAFDGAFENVQKLNLSCATLDEENRVLRDEVKDLKEQVEYWKTESHTEDNHP